LKGEVAEVTDFKKMAQDVQKEFEDRKKAEEDTRGAERARIELEYDKAARLLKRTVAPLLEQALTAFREQGVEARIQYDFEMHGNPHRKPAITFSCFGPKRRSDGYQFESPGVRFTTDLQTVSSGQAENTHPQVDFTGRSPIAQSDSLITRCARKVLEQYYIALDEWHRTGAEHR
jgi:hypothetical protein